MCAFPCRAKAISNKPAKNDDPANSFLKEYEMKEKAKRAEEERKKREVLLANIDSVRSNWLNFSL